MYKRQAAHCVEAFDELSEELLGVPVEADQIRIATPNMNRENVALGETLIISKVVFHPDYVLSDESFDDGFECAEEGDFGRCARFAEPGLADASDIALLELAEPLDSVPPVPPLPADLGSDALRTGAMVTLSGFGLVGLDQTSEDMPPSLNVAEALIEDTSGTEILTRPSDGGGDGCVGDSGGPLYVSVDGDVYVAGVTSRGRLDATLECGEGGIYTAVSSYEDWLEASTEHEIAGSGNVGGGGCSVHTDGTPATPLALSAMFWGWRRFRKKKSHNTPRSAH